jgi:hypothetical protein
MGIERSKALATRHDLNYVVTGLIQAATPHVYLSTVIDETLCDIACAFSWPLAMAKRRYL